jgi:hypothetical protein
MASEESWHALGDRLAPKDLWATILDKPGMVSLNMEGKRVDERKGYVRVKVEPSRRIKNGFGVYTYINDHYEIPDYKPESGCVVVIDTLIEAWDHSRKQARSIFDSIAGGLA